MFSIGSPSIFGDNNKSQQELEKQELEKQELEKLKRLGLDYIQQLENNLTDTNFAIRNKIYKYLCFPKMDWQNETIIHRFSCQRDFDIFLGIVTGNFKITLVDSEYFNSDDSNIKEKLASDNIFIAIDEGSFRIISNMNLLNLLDKAYTNNENKNQEIIEEFKSILGQDENQDEDAVSLFDLLNLIEQKIMNLAKFKYDIEGKLNSSNIKSYLESVLGITDDNYIEKLSISYDNSFPKVSIEHKTSRRFSSRNSIIVYNPENKDIYIDKRGTDDIKFAINLLDILGDDLIKLLKEGHSLNFLNRSTIIKTVNSKFHVIITETGILVQFIDYYAGLFLEYVSHKKYYNCLSYNTLKAMKDNGEEVFRNLFVRIENCPEYLQQELYELRQNQLEGKRKDFHL